MSITTNEQLRDHIHSIHDFLRNVGAGYGMTAMKIFMIFYGLKIIEPIIKQTPLDPTICKFSDIISNAQKKYGQNSEHNRHNPVACFIDNDILDELCKKSCQTEKTNFKFYMFYQIPRNLSDDVWIQVIKFVDKIPTNCNKTGIIDEKFDVDLSGKVYEYFIGRDQTAISELGAYFTNRHITQYAMNKVSPTLRSNGRVKSMIDPFGGSGGFTLGYVQYLNKHFGDKINWKNDISKINHCDMNEDVIKIAGLELFGLTSYLPKESEFKKCNTFKYKFDETYDFVFTNPPYGGDKKQKNTETTKCEKLIRYITNELKEINEQVKKNPKSTNIIELQKRRQDQLTKIKKIEADNKREQEAKQVNSKSCSKFIKTYIEENDLKTCNDKEACSLVLMMKLLSKNGICVGVLKEGVFFDKKYGSIRKHLIENFNVKYIVSVPQDQFENTSTKTSIIIFENTEQKTTEIEFYDLIIKKQNDDVFEEVEGEIELTVYKDEIIDVTDKLICKCKIDEIDKDYSLNYKKYLKNDIKVQKGFELVRLGDVCKFVDGYAFKTDDMTDKGTKLIQISNINNNMIIFKDNVKYVNYNEKKHKKYTVSNGDIIVGLTGNIQDKIAIFNKSENCILNQRVCKINEFETDLSKIYVYNYWVIFKLGKYIQFKANGTVQKNISRQDMLNIQIPYPDDKTMKMLEPTLNQLMKLHEEQQKLSNEIPQKENDICDLIKKLTDEGINGKDYDEYKLGDICVVKAGKYLKQYKNGIYPIIGGGDISGYIDNYTNENDYVIHKDGVSNKIISYVNGKFFINHHGWTVIMNTKFGNFKKYLYYWIKCETQRIMEKLIGSNQKGLNQNTFYDLQIKIIKPEIIKKHKLDKVFEQVDKMKTDLETNKKEHSELSIKFMKMIDPDYNENIQVNEPENNIDQSEQSEQNEIVEETEKKPKKKVQKKIEVDVIEVTKEVEKKPKKKKIQKEPEVEEENENTMEEEFEWNPKVLKLMEKHKEKTDENKAILIKLRNDNNIDKDLFWNKVKELRKEKQSIQKTK